MLIALAVVCAIIVRRPISRFIHKVPGKDLTIGVRVGDLFDGNSDVVVSANRSFDTDMKSGLISPNSIQGQFAIRFFNSNTDEIDKIIDPQLAELEGEENPTAIGKKKLYPLGTVVKVPSHGRIFYFVAMAELNENGNARATPRRVEDAL